MQYFFKTAKLEDGRLEARCDDIPGLVFGPIKDEDELYEYLQNGALLVALQDGFRKRRKAIPLPSSTNGSIAVYVPARGQAKIALWNWLVDNKVKMADLARKLGITPSRAQKLVDLCHDGASIEAIEQAVLILDGTFDLTIKKQP